MTTYIGFSTINQNKKFTLTDYDLIQRDLLNAFSIRQGELPGRPGYGTVIWNFLFENQIVYFLSFTNKQNTASCCLLLRFT